MRIFKNNKTGKRIECDDVLHKNLIESLEKNPDYKELVLI